MSSKRTLLLQDLRLVRSYLEHAIDDLRDMNLHSLQSASVALLRMEEALEALHMEIDKGTAPHNHDWPKRDEDEL